MICSKLQESLDNANVILLRSNMQRGPPMILRYVRVSAQREQKLSRTRTTVIGGNIQRSPSIFDLAEISAPFSARIFRTSRLFFSAAPCNGVQPLLFIAFIFAPQDMSAFTVSGYPSRDAIPIGVHPISLRISIFVLLSSRARTTILCPLLAVEVIGVHPLLLASSREAPFLRRISTTSIWPLLVAGSQAGDDSDLRHIATRRGLALDDHTSRPR